MSKILIIDDDLVVTSMLKIRLEANRYEVLTASDGESGLNLAREQQPDLIIVDIKMPKMDGYTFVLEIRKLNKDTPIIVLTAEEGMKDIFQMEKVNEYVVKPFRTEEFLRLIQKYLPPQAA